MILAMRYLLTALLITLVAASAPAQDEQPAIKIKRLPVQVAKDQRKIWAFPLPMARGSHWKPIAGFVGATIVLTELDSHDTPYFRRTNAFADFDKTFSTANTGLAEGLFPVSFYLIGLASGNSETQESGLHSVEALIDAEAVSEVVKNISRRKRPIEIPPDG